MKFTLTTFLFLTLALTHAAPSTFPTTSPNNPQTHLLHSRTDKASCVKVTLADGTIWDRYCQPARTCIKITKPEEAPVAFEMAASTVCTLFRGGKGNIDTLNAWCHGTSRDFEGSDIDLRPLPIWNSQNSKGWACYDRA